MAKSKKTQIHRKKNKTISQKRKTRKKVSRWLTNFLLALLLIAGLTLVFNDKIKNTLISLNSDKYAIDNVTREDIKRNMTTEATFDFDQVIPISTEEVLKAQFLEESDNLPLIGAIALPDVDINLPIFKGVAYNALFYGAGTLSPDQRMGVGNYSLASHKAMDASLLFSPLERSKVGQKIYLTDLADVYYYEIYEIKEVWPSEDYVLDEVPGEKMVTLITCSDGAGTKRLIVHGKLKSITAVSDSAKEMTDAFDLTKNTY